MKLCVRKLVNNFLFSRADNGSDSSVIINQNSSTETLLDLQPTTENNVPSVIENKKDEETILSSAEDDNAQKNLQCDDNQNNMNNRMLLMQNFNIGAASERILVNMKQLLALYAKLKRQLMEFTEVKANEQSSYKSKCDEMSSQVELQLFFEQVADSHEYFMFSSYCQ